MILIVCFGVLGLNLNAQNTQTLQDTKQSKAKKQQISPLPLPSQEVINIFTKKCLKSCLKELYDEGLYFSFIAAFRDYKSSELEKYLDVASNLLDTPLNIATLDKREANIAKVDSIIESKSETTSPQDSIIEPAPLPKIDTNKLKIALLIPQKSIGRYSSTSADSILLYLIASGLDFEFKTFNSYNEDKENLIKAYNDAQNENYNVVIAILTPKGLGALLKDNDNIKTPLFIPSMHRKQAGEFSDYRNVFFGGIDYEKQIDMIANVANAKDSVIVLDDDGYIGRMLGAMLRGKARSVAFSAVIDSKTSNNFKEIIPKFRAKIRKSVVVLNTSVVKSGLIVPQIGNTNTMPIAFLSTQMNYNLSLLSLIPKEDTDRLFIVSSISPNIDEKILAFGELMNTDVQYDWVNYATMVSLDSFIAFSDKKFSFKSFDVPKTERFFSEILNGNQIEYNDMFYGVKDSHFVPAKIK